MYLSEGDAKGLAVCAFVGVVVLVAAWLVGLPAVAVSLVWLAAPRLGFEVDWSVWWIATTALWLAVNVVALWWGQVEANASARAAQAHARAAARRLDTPRGRGQKD